MVKNRHLKIIPGFSGYKPDTVCFKTGAQSDDVYNFGQFAFEDGPGLVAPSAIRLFYERLILGSPFPDTLIVNRVEPLQNVVAASLFIDPSLVYEERCAALVYSLDLASRVGDVGTAHISTDHVSLASDIYQTLDNMPSKTLEDEYNRLHSAASVVSEYLRQGTLGFGSGISENTDRHFEVVERHGDFAVITTEHDQPVFDLVYREGVLCGVWFPEDRSRPVLFKKSSLVPYLDLSKVAQLLDKQEFGVSVSSAGWMQDFDPAMVSFPTKNPKDGTPCEGTSLSNDEVVSVVKEIYQQDRRGL